jgi:hypothetical protein
MGDPISFLAGETLHARETCTPLLLGTPEWGQRPEANGWKGSYPATAESALTRLFSVYNHTASRSEGRLGHAAKPWICENNGAEEEQACWISRDATF